MNIKSRDKALEMLKNTKVLALKVKENITVCKCKKSKEKIFCDNCSKIFKKRH